MQNLDPNTTDLQEFVISLLCSSFNFFKDNNLLLLTISWIISIILFGVFIPRNYKIPLYALISQIIFAVFGFIFYNRHSPITFLENRQNLIYGLLVSLVYISLLSISVLLKNVMYKKKQNQIITHEEISEENQECFEICPECGTRYDSNPKICYKCSHVFRK